jgi:23S rRNA pseudouridine2604 synthase
MSSATPDKFAFEGPIRLNKFMSDHGVCSRRDADTWIEEGRVTLDEQPAVLGDYVLPGVDVRVDGELIKTHRKPKRVYLAFNKPVGIECTTDERVDGNIAAFINHPERVFPIGRLDKDSDGLILLTNDGDIVNKILRAEHAHEKEYMVTVNKPVNPEFLRNLAVGVQLDPRTTTLPCKTRKLGPQTFGIILTQGLNRQIRKMCQAFGYRVQKLTRVRVMNVLLGHLRTGAWRNLTPPELATMLTQLSAARAVARKTASAKPVMPRKPIRKAQAPGAKPAKRATKSFRPIVPVSPRIKPSRTSATGATTDAPVKKMFKARVRKTRAR